MANVAVIYNPVPDEPARWATPAAGQAPPWQARYVASLEPVAALGALLRQQGVEVGMERAERWIALSDGGSGLDAFLRTHFPRVDAVSLAFYHAAAHLSELAKAGHGTEEKATEALRQEWCHQLKHAGGQALLATLRGLDLRGRSAAPPASVIRLRCAICGEPRPSHGLPQVSGQGVADWERAVESACKRVVGQRLKGAGMRWGEEGAEAVCRLRALFLSETGPWETFWSRN